MDTVRDRLPSRHDAWLLLMTCVFPIHAWSILIYLYEVPAYMKRMPVVDMLGIFAYTQAFALIESLLVCGFLIFVCIALPHPLFKDKFVGQGAILFILVFIWMIPVHYQVRILEGLDWNRGLYQGLVIAWVIAFFIVLLGSLVSLRRSSKFEKGILALVERIVVLSWVNILVDILSFLVVIYRNLF